MNETWSPISIPQYQWAVWCYDAMHTSVETLEERLKQMPAHDYVARNIPHKAWVELLKILNVPTQPSGYTFLRTGNSEQDAYRTWSIVLRSDGETCVFAHALPELPLPILSQVSDVSENQEPVFKIYDTHDTPQLLDCMLASGLRKNKALAEQDLQAELKWGEVRFVERHAGKVVWFVSWGPRSFHDRRGEFELLHIWVDPTFQGKGSAKVLFNWLVDYAKSYYQAHGSYLRKFWLYTAQTTASEKDQRRHGFYQKMLMEVAGCSINKFGQGKTEIEYALNFDAQGNLLPHNPFWEKIIALFQQPGA
jgi:GNAT superfamily N-acetyltransferase